MVEPTQNNTTILESNTYYVGDNLDLLKNVKNNSINLIYFDPPYNTGRNFFNFDDRFKCVEEYISLEVRLKNVFVVLNVAI